MAPSRKSLVVAESPTLFGILESGSLDEGPYFDRELFLGAGGEKEVAAFRALVRGHYAKAGRAFPWRETRDPWAILVSEIMLQQTQTERVVPKYEAFLAAFPKPADLASAPLSGLLPIWSGLGYNRRALALKRAAETIQERYGGVLPPSAEELDALPGVGPYTARAVMLTEKVRRKPYSVVLFDEIEKAHPEVFNILLQLLEEGELRDNLGHVVSFRNAVVIMTSNAGSREIQTGGLGFRPDERLLSYAEIRSSALSELKRRFNPEFVNRVDDIVVFKPLERAEIKKILELFLSELGSRLAAKGIALEASQGAKEYLAEKGYDPAYGARPMRRLIQSQIEDRLAEEILQGRLGAGQTALVELRGGLIGVRPKKSALKMPASSGPVGKN